MLKRLCSLAREVFGLLRLLWALFAQTQAFLSCSCPHIFASVVQTVKFKQGSSFKPQTVTALRDTCYSLRAAPREHVAHAYCIEHRPKRFRATPNLDISFYASPLVRNCPIILKARLLLATITRFRDCACGLAVPLPNSSSNHSGSRTPCTR